MAKQYVVNSEATNNKPLQVEMKGSNFLVTYDGISANKISKGQYEVACDEETVAIQLKGNMYTGIFATMFGNEIELLRKLAWYEMVIAIITLAPCLLFGAIGGASGAVFAFLNLTMMRSVESVPFKVVIGLIFAGIAVTVAWFIAVQVALVLYS